MQGPSKGRKSDRKGGKDKERGKPKGKSKGKGKGKRYRRFGNKGKGKGKPHRKGKFFYGEEQEEEDQWREEQPGVGQSRAAAVWGSVGESSCLLWLRPQLKAGAPGAVAPDSLPSLPPI